jgi:hypothetical protein
MANKHDRAFLEVVTRLYIPVEEFPSFNIDDFLKQANKVKIHTPIKQRKEKNSNAGK